MRPTVAFVILAWNSEAYIADCLRSIFALTAVKPFVYAMNNGSIDQTGIILDEFAVQYPQNMEIITYPENMGTTIPRNRAMKKAGKMADWICVLDSDTVINELAILRLMEAMEQDQRIIMTVPRMWNADNVEQPSCKKFPSIRGKLYKAIPSKNMQKKGVEMETYPFFPDKNKIGTPPVSADKNVYPVDYGISACWFLRKSVIKQVGYMDEKYFYAPEDVDYCVRIWKSGYHISLVSSASIYHLTQRLSHKKILSKINVKHVQGLFRFFHLHHKYLKKSRLKTKG